MKQILSILLFCAAIFQSNCAGAQGAKSQLKIAAVDTSFLLPVNGVKQYLEIKGASATTADLPGRPPP
jgi:hypothetical protein